MKYTKMAIYIIYSKDNAVVESLFTQIEQSTGVIPSHYDVNNINLNGHSSIENVVTAFELAASITLDMTQLSIDNKVAMRKLEGNNYVVVTTVSDEAIKEEMSSNIKTARQKLLIDSDWTDTLSAKTRLGDVLYQAWQDYRQALRDITLQPDYPLEVIWPIAP
jgi:hypothetical protein